MSWDDCFMQGRERMDRQLLDAGALVGHLVPAGSMFAFLAAHRQDLFGDEDFADLFPSGKGRPSVLADAVATQDTITQLAAAIRRCARVVPGAAELIASVCTGHDYSQPGKPRIDWDDPAAKDALVSALVNDANALVSAIGAQELDEPAA